MQGKKNNSQLSTLTNTHTKALEQLKCYTVHQFDAEVTLSSLPVRPGHYCAAHECISVVVVVVR